jgi:hypothetical protein
VGRDSKEERRLKRAGEELQKGLSRGDLDRALPAFLVLPASEQGLHAARVAELVRRDVTSTYARRAWARLSQLAGYVERDERVVSAGAADDQILEARWALLWGRARSGDWQRARLHLDAVRPALARSPFLAPLSALVESKGAPDAAACELMKRALADRPTSVDARLGYDPGQRAEALEPISPPVNEEEVEPRLLAFFARTGWQGFAATAEAWARRADPKTERRIRILAAQLSVQELLMRAQRGPEHAAEPALFIAQACVQADAAQELEAELLLALRLATAALPKDEPVTREPARLYATVAKAALRSAALLPVVAGTTENTLFTVDARPFALDLLRLLLEHAFSASLWIKACAVWALPGQPGILPPWLTQGLTRLLDIGDELRVALRRSVPRIMHLVVDAISQLFPLAITERALDELWDERSAEWSQVLARAFDNLLDRARQAATTGRSSNAALKDMVRSMFGDAGEEAEFQELWDSREGRYIRRVAEAELSGKEHEPLPSQVQPLWRRFKDRVLPFSVDALEMALANSASPREQQDAVERFAAGRDRAVKWLQAIKDAGGSGCRRAHRALLETMLTRYGQDAQALAEALLAAKDMGAPPEIMRVVAAALTDAAQVLSPDARKADLLARALLAAKIWDRRSATRPKRTRKRSSGNGAGKAAPRSRRRPAGEQAELDLSGDAPARLQRETRS